jgi:hypothetical protein
MVDIRANGGSLPMMRTALIHWLQAPVFSGWAAIAGGIAIVSIPTGVREIFDGVVTGCEFTPYLPFVFLAAILLGWWQAGTVALASVAILGGLFEGPLHFQLPCFLSAAGMFLAGSMALIGAVVLIRRAIAVLTRRGVDESAGGIVFSLDKGRVWASWYGQDVPILLGSQRKVAEMMQDFLTQAEFGKRLNQVSPTPKHPELSHEAPRETATSNPAGGTSRRSI